jgi:hypothetical protein
MPETTPQPSYLDEVETAYLKRFHAHGDRDLVIWVYTHRDDPAWHCINATLRRDTIRGYHGKISGRTREILAGGPYPNAMTLLVRDLPSLDEAVLFLTVPPPRAFPPDPVLILAAEDFRGDLVIRSELDFEVCIQAAIEEAEWRIVEGEAGSVLITGWGSALAIVRRNHQLFDPDSPGEMIEVARFARPC